MPFRRLLLLALCLAASQQTPAQPTPHQVNLIKGPAFGKSLYHRSYALIIGINIYPNLPKKFWLRYAEKDAQDFASVLVKSYGFERNDVKLLLGSNATKDAIHDALESFADTTTIQKNDRIFVYFSGQAKTVKVGTARDVGFLIPQGAILNMGKRESAVPFLKFCIPMKEIWSALAQSPAKHTLVVADACFDAPRTAKILSNDGIAPQLGKPARMLLTAGDKDATSEERTDLSRKLLQELTTRATADKPFLIKDLYRSVADPSGPQLSSDDTEGQIVFSPVADAGLDFTALEARTALEKGEVDNAFSMFKQLADKGDPDGLAGLATCYLEGAGVQADPAKALEYSKESAGKGSPWGMSRLGALYETNPTEAFAWFQKAAALGDPVGLRDLAYCYRKGLGVAADPQKSFDCYLQAATAGDPDSMRTVGVCYRDGVQVKRDFPSALKWLTPAADAGDMAAVNELGTTYSTGKGVPVDFTEAEKWFRKAADASDPLGLFNVGESYSNGAGEVKDEIEAIVWYRKSAEAGYGPAMERLGEIYRYGIGIDADPREAVSWFQKGVNAGNPKAMYELANMYAEGRGIPKDLDKALALYRKAAALGVKEAADKLEKLGG